jgi:hypothetical protein
MRMERTMVLRDRKSPPRKGDHVYYLDQVDEHNRNGRIKAIDYEERIAFVFFPADKWHQSADVEFEFSQLKGKWKDSTNSYWITDI